MITRQFRFCVIVGAFVVLTLAVWLYRELASQGSRQGTEDQRTNTATQEAAATKAVSSRGAESGGIGSFPINDTMELPFLGNVRCHSRPESVSFTANGRKLEWPFKVYYLPNGMLVRAEFRRPGAKDYEKSPKALEESYRIRAQRLVGFPERPAPASLSKVLQSLYENEPFDRATKINITWVIRDGTEAGGTIKPWFIANIFGVSPGLMRVPDEDEGFLKYRILLTPEGEAVYTDNLL